MTIYGMDASCAHKLPTVAYYSSKSGGWTEGRLGQIYDLIDAVREDRRTDNDLANQLHRLMREVELIDRDLAGELAA